jgi:spoIIIJ-associated protein
MTSQTRRFFSGDTLEQAIMQAARHHQIEPDQVVYTQIEKRHGFLKRRRGVVIEVDPEVPARTGAETEEPAREPEFEISAVEAAPPLDHSAETAAAAELEESMGDEERFESASEESAAEDSTIEEPMGTEPAPEESVPGGIELAEATGELADAARQALQEILQMAALDLESSVRQGDEQLEIELWGTDQEKLLEDRGNLLLAIQHLMPRVIRGISGESTPCRVDCDNFHASRQEDLEGLARMVAAEVHRQGRPRTLEPMNPAERRIIHLALSNDDEVVTESEGRGFFKRVTIRPARRRPRGFDRYSR